MGNPKIIFLPSFQIYCWTSLSPTLKEGSISKWLIKEGDKITIVTWCALVEKSIQASNNVEISAEIIDIRTLNPLDMDTILNSIIKTNRVLIVHEDNITNGFGGEIASKIIEDGFEHLDAPIKRVASKDFPVPYASELENEILVQTSWIESAIKEIIEY